MENGKSIDIVSRLAPILIKRLALLFVVVVVLLIGGLILVAMNLQITFIAAWALFLTLEVIRVKPDIQQDNIEAMEASTWRMILVSALFILILFYPEIRGG